jgi:hypothetical protein
MMRWVPQAAYPQVAAADFYLNAAHVAFTRGRVHSPGETGLGLLVAPIVE